MGEQMSIIYLIGPSDWRVGRVKIGVTTQHPKARLTTFQTGSPFPLELYAWFDGGYRIERLLHEAFQPLWSHREWFFMDGKLLAFVSDIYFETFGRRKTTSAELQASLQELLLVDDPPHPSFSSQEEWDQSACSNKLREWSLVI